MSARYPHLLPEDVPVWERFLDAYGQRYTHFEYDVRTLPHFDPGPEWPDNYRKMAMSLSARRIDAIGHFTTGIHIIEVTTSAGLTAVGQLTTYPVLYKMTYHPQINISPLLVAESLQTGIEEVLNAHFIAFVLV
jgi:hypothetical protein